MWLLCGEITKLDIRLAVWQLYLLSDGFHLYQRHKWSHDKDYATTRTTLQPLPVQLIKFFVQIATMVQWK